MNKFMKKAAAILIAVLMVSSMVVGASAAGTSCTGNNGSSNQFSFSVNSKGSGCLNGFDVNSILESLKSSGCLNQTDDTSDCNATQAPDTNGAVPAVPNTANQNTNCGTANTNTNGTNATTKQPTAILEVSDTANCGDSKCRTSNCDGSQCATNSDCEESDCANKGNCMDETCQTTGNCVTDGSKCDILSAATTNSSTGNTFWDRVNSALSKCGTGFKKFCLNLSGSNAPAPTQTQVPSATPAPSSTPTPPADNGNTRNTNSGTIDNLSFEQQVVKLVNEQRTAKGLAPLTLNTELSKVARVKSQDMHDKNYFSHTSPTYGSPFDMLKSFGISYRTAGENIAMGYSTPEAVMNAWMNSAGHRANILNASYTQIGVGYVADGNYWTQEFIG